MEVRAERPRAWAQQVAHLMRRRVSAASRRPSVLVSTTDRLAGQATAAATAEAEAEVVGVATVVVAVDAVVAAAVDSAAAGPAAPEAAKEQQAASGPRTGRDPR